ncbi:MAG: hypothetical protein QG549_162 [Patescibacteria group bacterium]|nr:hypothetical protein [Patescibacteria group bacterium]
MSNRNDHAAARKRSNLGYALVCILASLAFVTTASFLVANSNPAFVLAIVGWLLSLVFLWNADRSSWHPLRDVQSD